MSSFGNKTNYYELPFTIKTPPPPPKKKKKQQQNPQNTVFLTGTGLIVADLFLS